MKYIKTGKKILETLKELNDIVVPTMGARGMLAAIEEEMDRPTLTDDGVTVVKHCTRTGDKFKDMVIMGAIEAAHNTERIAYDGTTLTIMMVYELYKKGFELIQKGMHPQTAANEIELGVKRCIESIKAGKLEVDDSGMVESIATISTKIPEVGHYVSEAYKLSGKSMNIIVEHDRSGFDGIRIEHVKGYKIDSGYFSEAMRAFCNVDGESTEFEGCRVCLLKDGIVNAGFVSKFMASIPKENVGDPILFLMDAGVNPEGLRILLNAAVTNNLKCQFVFINEPRADDIYLDISDICSGGVQDSDTGKKDYLWSDCGVAEKVRVDIDGCLIIGEGNVSGRLKSYDKRLSKDKYALSESERALIEKRMSALTSGVTKIKVGVPTIIAFKTMKLKFDDGIGAARMALKHGVILGGGKALWNINDKLLGDVMKKPLETICYNAGVKVKGRAIKNERFGYNVVTGLACDLAKERILDGYCSIEQALINGSSIACQYLKCYLLMVRE